jgi:hypothetical protein
MRIIRIHLAEGLPAPARKGVEYQEYLRELQGRQSGVIFFFPEDETARIDRTQWDHKGFSTDIDVEILAEKPSEMVLRWLDGHSQAGRLTYDILVL